MSDSLFPTSRGRMIWAVPGWVEVELVTVVVEELLEAVEVVLLTVDGVVLVVVRLEMEEVVDVGLETVEEVETTEVVGCEVATVEL